jgi:hypothetical protein
MKVGNTMMGPPDGTPLVKAPQAPSLPIGPTGFTSQNYQQQLLQKYQSLGLGGRFAGGR